MKLVVKCALVATLAVSSCLADVIDFASSTSTTNSTANPTVAAPVNPSWAAALGSSIWVTAQGYDTPALNTEVTFTESFILPAGFTDADLNLGVYADDSATVMIDGTTLFTKQTELGAHCVAVGIGCANGAEGVIDNMNVTADLHSGVNTITFFDYQEVGGTSFGVDFAGSVSYKRGGDPPPPNDPPQNPPPNKKPPNDPPKGPPNDPPCPDPTPSVPEPGSILLLLSALVPVGLLIRRKASSRR
jgi:hypothetical protein